MKSTMIPLVAIFLVLACATHDIAPRAQSTPVSLPQLKGTWQGEHRTHFRQKTFRTRMRIIITEQDGEIFRGVYEWEDPDEGRRGQERIVGIIGFDGGIHIAEETDTGRIDAELVGPDKMRAVYVEAGEGAGVFRVEMTRTSP